MTELARRTIDELLVRYELEPELKDVFVEGKFDQEVLLSFFRDTSTQHLGRMVYEIDSVEVPAELLIKHNLSEGNKQRVIVLARELSGLPPESSYRCLVDKDLDHWFGDLETTARLIWTEFSSIELNFFSDEILREILITTAKIKLGSWKEYCESLIITLSDLYVLRLADKEFGWSLEWLPVDKFLSHEKSMIVFDVAKYVERLLMKNKKIALRGEFESSVIAWKERLSGDHRNHIRGHDFVELLAWTVHNFRGIKTFATSLAIQRLFVLLASPRSRLEIGLG